jgi:glutamyl/glutaminyl-tRNA synthetase
MYHQPAITRRFTTYIVQHTFDAIWDAYTNQLLSQFYTLLRTWIKDSILMLFYKMDICKAFDTIDDSKQLCNFDFKEFPIP